MKVAVPHPCHEDWSRMTPVERGAFCSSCKKVVRDFSKDSEEDILRYLLEHRGEKVCGRFAVQQVMPNVKMEVRTLPPASNPFRIFACAVLLVFGAPLFRCCTVKGENVNAIEFKDDTIPALEVATLIAEPMPPAIVSEIPDPSEAGEKKENVSVDSVQKSDTVKQPAVFIPSIVNNMGPPEIIAGPVPFSYSWTIPEIRVDIDLLPAPPWLYTVTCITGVMVPVPFKESGPPYPFTGSAKLPLPRIEQGSSDAIMNDHEHKKDGEIVVKQKQFLTEENDFPTGHKRSA